MQAIDLEKALRYDLVVFADLLGQGNRLLELTKLPTTDQEHLDTLAKLKKTVGNVLGFRQLFSSFFNSFSKRTGLLDSLPPELASQAQEMSRSVLRFRGFSDSVIIDVPLIGLDENCVDINGVFGALTAIACTFPLLIAADVPLRVGIDVGLAIDVCEGEVYGPALVRAYRLESKRAGWPRIVVGNGLVSYLDQMACRPRSTPAARYATRMAAKCRSFIAQDVDATFFLDYFGPAMRDLGDELPPEIVDECLAAVAAQLREHADDVELRDRWSKVRSYIESRTQRR
jgi:hypothetical protein